ncbi:dihydrolipoamide acetyltransferase family protein [Pseudonocardia cypriaca]|uniref:Dihydrolipoamide acetyltransferase component of pyruvate dehydrogenase complex n=1 Tax=Pseudonocardia cypriaca TaxID=882449 RepID=A0A543FVH3_9PSEU|nr:dihydrolipoamide acetyltransferase family protein [Pseudonocardia cypriaca]TQM37809.1 pyruvate dehydrogenase E2 component (dihydrolipoamide acetyltransferase) [Pseudonocardia cypriaca]
MTETVFTLPDLGEGLTEAELVQWLVKPGDTVAVDAPVAEVETAKATVEVPSPFAGIVAELHGAEGSTIPVGAPLVTFRSPQGSGNVLVGYGTTEAPSRRRRYADAPDRPKIVSPVVRQLARRAGLDPATLVGTGPDGVITRADVERAIDARRTPEAEDVDRRTGLPVLTRVPLTGVRGHIARTMARSRAEIPEATTWVDVDATALLALREDMRAGDWKPGLLALLARFVVAGLREYPALNSRVDAERDEVVHLDGVNLGVATQTERGLVVPAVRGADRLSIRRLDSEIRRLTGAAREGTATATELGSGSFTLNNYGVFGVDGSAAIINHPEAAILGIGRIHPRPWVVGGEVVPRRIAQLSLVFDHRVCDGGVAGGFLRFVADAVESPLQAVADL